MLVCQSICKQGQNPLRNRKKSEKDSREEEEGDSEVEIVEKPPQKRGSKKQRSVI